MRLSLKVIIYLMTAGVRLSVSGNKEGRADLTYWDDITPVAIHNSTTGQTVNIECTYPKRHEKNEKFLCKGRNPFSCNQLINTTEQERTVVNGRFHIRDNGRRSYFYVYIKNLSTDDSGCYWCCSCRTEERAGCTKILLSVALDIEQPNNSSWYVSRQFESRASRTPPLMMKTTQEKVDKHVTIKRSDPPVQQTTESSPTRKDLHSDLTATVVVCLVLLLILLLVLILCKHRLPRTQVCCAARGSTEQRTNDGPDTQENHGEHHYDEIQMLNQQASSGDALMSVYATVNAPADQLHYASVSFQKDSVTVSTNANAPPDTDKNHSTAYDYSSISGSQGVTHPPAAEQTQG